MDTDTDTHLDEASAPRKGIRYASAVKMRLEEEICSLISEVQEFNLSTIERIELPTALDFHRFVAANRPVIITLPASATTVHAPSATRVDPTPQERQWAWPAFTKWTNEYLSKTLGQKEITVACTPNGWADAVVDDKYFAMPCEKKMTFDQFLDGMPIRTRQKDSHRRGTSEQDKGLRESKDLETRTQQLDLEGPGQGDRDLDPYQEVRYIQLQNGNLMTEYQELMDDVPVDIPFASEALGKLPDAVNFWYGDERSSTSLHKDHYENMYAVIAGRKIFTLIPPTEQFCLHEQTYIAATYVDVQEASTEPSGPSDSSSSSPSSASPRYKLEPLDPIVHTKWIALNPSHEPKEELFEKYPRFQMCQPFRVELNPGEILYLPAMWYHQVEQEPDHEGKCIAVNWWYDMGFEGDRFATATFMSSLVRLVDQIDGTS
ncbi:JmjC domain-containing protein 7 [Mortierella alpina]|nr:JmjC domain-containing protein 7 [Mortierella alpina]